VNDSAPLQQPSFKEALRFWCKLGWISFGGTAAHIAIMHDELVEKKRWISNGSFLHALGRCMILPGPEAQQLAIYIGGSCTASGAASWPERSSCCLPCLCCWR
jgi:chromate transporter